MYAAIKKHGIFWGTGSIITGAYIRVFQGAQIAEMLLNYSQDSLNAILGVILSVGSCALMGFGAALIFVVIAPRLWSIYQAEKNKRYTVPVKDVIIYIFQDSILAEPLIAEPTVKPTIDHVFFSAKAGKFKVFGRNNKTGFFEVIPKSLFSSEYGMGLIDGKEGGTTYLAKRNPSNPEKEDRLYTGLMMNEDDMLKEWPPHDKNFLVPSSWIQLQV